MTEDNTDKTTYHVMIGDDGVPMTLLRLRRTDGSLFGETYTPNEGWIESAQAFDVMTNGQDYDLIGPEEAAQAERAMDRADGSAAPAAAKEIPFSDMHAGDTVFECNQHNGSLQVRVLTDPIKGDAGWSFKGWTPKGLVDYLIGPDTQHLLGSYFYGRPLYDPVASFEPGPEDDIEAYITADTFDADSLGAWLAGRFGAVDREDRDEQTFYTIGQLKVIATPGQGDGSLVSIRFAGDDLPWAADAFCGWQLATDLGADVYCSPGWRTDDWMHIHDGTAELSALDV